MLRTSVVAPILVSITLLLGLVLYPERLQSLIPTYAVNEVAVNQEGSSEPTATSTIFFTGDVMLARHVEALLNHNGSNYPYRQLGWLRDTPAYVVGNFESALPQVHEKTPNFGFRFSTSATHIPALRAAGFTHLSQANNHALDFGEVDFNYAKGVFASSSLTTFGHPIKVSSSSVTYLELNNERMALIGLHTLFSEPTEDDLREVIGDAAAQSDFQIAYVHWGVEYEHEPSSAQRNLAKILTGLGIDLIIGHHPHVTQSVELVDGVPVFYSLGNFIFDQYFSADVQDGLVLRLDQSDKGHLLTLLPVTSRSGQAEPRLMTDTERTEYLSQLANWSTPELSTALLSGELTLPHTLATLTETAIMGE